MLDPAYKAFSYAIIRVVPSIERGESFNAGVVLLCRQRDFLGALVALDEARLRALAPHLSSAAVMRQLDHIAHVAAGEPQAGRLAALPSSERFGWLVAPSSTVVQPSPVHVGLTTDPAGSLGELFQRLVT